MNTNNARAFHVFVTTQTKWKRTRFLAGSAAHTFRQSSPGGANYRDCWTVDFFLAFEFEELDVRMEADAFLGAFIDNNRGFYPNGWASSFYFPLFGNKLLVRAEWLNASPAHEGHTFKQFQAGPVFTPSRNITVFVTEQYAEPGHPAGEVATFIRARLAM
jgi:hypothetical protein